jgi:signal transduction histidine kinase
LRYLVLAGAVALVWVVGLADYLTGVELSFSIFYLIPVSLAAWFLGRGPGLFVSLVSAATWFANDSLFREHPYSHSLIPYWNALARLGMFLIVTLILAQLSDALHRERQAREELSLSYAALDGLRKQQLLVKDQLLANVSHELRTPLGAVQRFVTMLVDGTSGELRPQQREALDSVLRNVDQLTRMIQDLLDATRADTGKLTIEPRPLQLKEVSSEVIRALHPRAGELDVSLVDEVPLDLPTLLADPARVRQVLFNLVDNALKFTPKGGRVEIRSELRDAEPGYACITVSYTGLGIRPEAQRELFQRLHQARDGAGTSRQGLGLGLYIARELVTRQGGRIWVESQPDRGSRFTFTLPLAGDRDFMAADATRPC